MADFSHLERMGRELKCPICLSLVNSAVSLACNHVFCNLCIEKSMKSASSCPVCKVPFRRREVRPAPHMDNLVSVYKSMEVASGINIFVTQTAPSVKVSEEENQHEGGRVCGRQEDSQTCQDRLKNNRKFKGKGSKQPLNSNQESPKLDTVKPSFPTKKRVQVPQHPSSETPRQPAVFEGGMVESAKNQPQKSSVLAKEKNAVKNRGEPAFTPFFWLRDEDDAENLSQQMDLSQNLDTPPKAPSFSDIRDSDNEMAPKGATNIGLSDADYFDSEMFEWTQRPCSPELCSSPIKKQVEDTNECVKLQEKENKASSQGGSNSKDHIVEKNAHLDLKQMAENEKASLTALSSLRSENSLSGERTKKSKRGRKARERTKKKQANSTTGLVQVESQKVAESTSHRKDNFNVDMLHNRTCKRDKKVMFDTVGIHVLENIPALPVGAIQVNETMVTNLPASSPHKETIGNSSGLQQRDHPKRSKIHSLNSSDTAQKQSIKRLISQSSNISDLGVRTSKKGKKATTNPRCDQDFRSSKKQKLSTDDISLGNKLVDGVFVACNKLAVMKSQASRKLQGSSKIRVLQNSSDSKKTHPSRVVLHKCVTAPPKNQCAFCHSTEDSEASGVMVHYFNGKPVSADFNGGSKLVHAHRNCTEWAPNVYFEDDNAINLEVELSRSRRIKCCCCDVKGAALGCYDKSCRKSFHVPCAKLMPQCRWDSDNFVMLCPLHASSKLPNETSDSQNKRKKKSIPIPKRPTQSHQPEDAVKNSSSTCRLWNTCGSSDKLVLCCSAFTNEEKEIVSKFERLSGIPVLKHWDSGVTHVIASTDENGACRRTLKILMGILDGKWILSIEWIKACMKAEEPVDELPYEIGVDIHGIRDGPRLGRLRVLNEQPKLFNGLKFYFFGEFVTSYKGYLHDLIIAAGGTVLQRKPISGDKESQSSGNPSSNLIIYSLELPDENDPSKRNLIFNQRRSDAQALASSTGAIVASNSWVLNSIAASKLQNLSE